MPQNLYFFVSDEAFFMQDIVLHFCLNFIGNNYPVCTFLGSWIRPQTCSNELQFGEKPLHSSQEPGYRKPPEIQWISHLGRTPQISAAQPWFRGCSLICLGKGAGGIWEGSKLQDYVKSLWFQCTREVLLVSFSALLQCLVHALVAVFGD